MSTPNLYLFDQLAVFVLFFVEKPRHSLKIVSFLRVAGLLSGEGQQETHEKVMIDKEN